MWSHAKKLTLTIKKEIFKHPFQYAFLAAIIFGALFVRVYRTEDLLGFYYDQGRDAMVVWKLWHEGKLFLIGPVTGLPGIFLGPFYYYLIAPFYLIGGGSPVIPAYFLAILAVFSIILLFVVAQKMFGKPAAFVAVIIASFSYYITMAGRWLSNPTPIFLTQILLLYAMWNIALNKKVKNRDILWVWIAILIGLSLQLESASAVFYIPMIIVFAIWQHKKLPKVKYFLISLLSFLITLVPQLLFNIRHDNLLFNNFNKLFIEERGFNANFLPVIDSRLNYFWEVFNTKVFPSHYRYVNLFYYGSVLGLVPLIFKGKYKELLMLFIFLTVPMLGYIFFQGNSGNIYDYYMTGYYLVIVLLFSAGMGFFWRNNLGKLFVIYFLIVFLNMNLELIKNHLVRRIDTPTHITLGNQLLAVNAVFDDALGKEKFNVDVYVPPVIPHSYDYLFNWQGYRRCGVNICGLVKDSQADLLYTLYEVDPPHPERLISWLERQAAIGRVLEEKVFGGIVVQKRERIK